MTLRRDFLAFTAGAVTARTVLPAIAQAEEIGADDELLRLCARFHQQHAAIKAMTAECG